MSILLVNRAEYESKLREILEGLGYGGVDGTISNPVLSVINYVKIKLDELIPEGEGIYYALSTAPNTSNPIDMFIHSHLQESIKDISLSAPKNSVYQVGITGSGTPMSDGAKYGYIALPLNFLRLHSLKMADWKREVSEPVALESKEYRKQSNQYNRAGVNKPVVALNWKPITVGAVTTMSRIVEYYSVDTSHVIEKLYYIPSVSTADYTMDDFIVNNPHLIDSLAWMCAGKIMQITGQMDAFKLAMEQVKLSFLNL